MNVKPISAAMMNFCHRFDGVSTQLEWLEAEPDLFLLFVPQPPVLGSLDFIQVPLLLLLLSSPSSSPPGVPPPIEEIPTPSGVAASS